MTAAASEMRSWKQIVGLTVDQPDPRSTAANHQSQPLSSDGSTPTLFNTSSDRRSTPYLRTNVGELPATEHSYNYGPTNAADNARVHLGNANYNVGSGSHFDGPSNVAGDMNVRITNAFYNWNQDLIGNRTAGGQLAALKAALYYASMDDRKAQLSAFKFASLEWVWTETDLPSWLRSTESTFWISGKPGSGKSTLMHYLADSDQGLGKVQDQLRSHRRTWLVLRFYFDFRAGQGIANTPVGMLRSLLLQLVEKSDTMAEAVSEKCMHRFGGNWPNLERELLDLIAEASHSVNITLCAFIDGLDEYRGGLQNLMYTITTLQERSGMKLCLASRPESELAFQLQKFPGFIMQTHNHGTIKAYVDDARASMIHYSIFVHLQAILDDIEAHANGIILWARFAVDEVVSGVLEGCTPEEIQERLDTFPPELQAFYDRIWDDLSKVRLQAAIAFTVAGHWDSSFRGCAKSCPLYAEHLMVIWCKTLRQLQPTSVFGPGFTETQFRLRIHAMVKGLIEFVPTKIANDTIMVVRLVHKSLENFLTSRQEYTQLVTQIKTILDLEAVGPRFFAQVIVDASEDLEPASYLVWKPRHTVSISQERLKFIIGQARPRQTTVALRYTAECVTSALASLANLEVLDAPQHRNLLISAFQSPLTKHFLEAVNSHWVDLHIPQWLPPWTREHPELHWLMLLEYVGAFELVARQFLHTMPSDDKVFLYTCLLPLLTDKHLENHSGFVRILLELADAVPWQANYLALTIASARHKLFDDLASKLPHEVSETDRSLSMETWWPHRNTDITFCWAFSPFQQDCIETQRRRLRILLDMGIRINDQLQGAGTVAHLLFVSVDSAWLSDGFLSLPHGRFNSRYRPEIGSNIFQKWNFSIAKFAALMEQHVDLTARSETGLTVPEAAAIFAESLHRNLDHPSNPNKSRIKNNAIHDQIAVMDGFILPVLEGWPATLPWLLEKASETPIALAQLESLPASIQDFHPTMMMTMMRRGWKTISDMHLT